MQNLKELLLAHLQKDSKIYTYLPRVEANLVNEKPNFNLTWSWWAFFFTWAFFLYRKMYIPAFIFFVLNLALTAIPFSGLIISIIAGASAFYFYTSKFYSDLQKADYQNRSLEEVTKDLVKLGGYHTWVTVFALIVYLFILFFFSIIPGVFALTIYTIS